MRLNSVLVDSPFSLLLGLTVPLALLLPPACLCCGRLRDRRRTDGPASGPALHESMDLEGGFCRCVAASFKVFTGTARDR